MTVQPTKNDPADRSDEGHLELKSTIISSWLGRQGSNLRIPGPKPGALPLGHAPLI